MTPGPAPARRRTAATSAKAVGRFVVLTGLSGAGKSQAIRALEDLGYFCVDNLPITLIPTLAELSLRAGSEIPKVAIVVDVREGAFLSRFPRAIRALKARRTIDAAVIFLEASDDALVRRFSETRRPHPLAKDRPVVDGIREERERLAPIRAGADQIVDTSDLTVHELREAFMAVSRGHHHRGRLLITFLSFGFKHGVPMESDLVFDVRCLANPHYEPALQPLTGRDPPVVAFLEKETAVERMYGDIHRFVASWLPDYARDNRNYLTVAIGCTGGRHRSVMMAETLRRALADVDGVRLRVRHRDIDMGND